MKDREAWRAAVHGVTKSWTQLGLNNNNSCCRPHHFHVDQLLSCDSIDCSLPGFSVHGISQHRVPNTGTSPCTQTHLYPLSLCFCGLHAWSIASLSPAVHSGSWTWPLPMPHPGYRRNQPPYFALTFSPLLKLFQAVGGTIKEEIEKG